MEYQSMKLSGKQFNLVQFNFCFELVQSSNCPISKFAVTFSDIFIPYSWKLVREMNPFSFGFVLTPSIIRLLAGCCFIGATNNTDEQHLNSKKFRFSTLS